MSPRGIRGVMPLGLLAMASLFANVQAASMGDLLETIPSCAQSCVLVNIQAAGCSLSDVSLMSDCLCQNTTLLSTLSTCTQMACNFTDQTLTFNAERSLCAAYPKVSRTSVVRNAAIAAIAVAVPVVLARFTVRLAVPFETTRRIWWDDWTALLGMILLVIVAALEITSAAKGFGMHYWDVEEDKEATILQLDYIFQLLYISIQVLAKISIAFMFKRVFPARWIQLATKMFIIYMFAHSFIFLMVRVFQCRPIYAAWDKDAGKCLNMTVLSTISAALSIVEDLLLIIMVIPELIKAQFTRRQRVSLGIMFGIASFATVTSVLKLRFVVMHRTTYDPTWDNVDIVLWSLIELLCTVLLGSLPPLIPYIGRAIPTVRITWNKSSTEKSSSNSKSSNFESYKEPKNMPSSPSRESARKIPIIDLPVRPSNAKRHVSYPRRSALSSVICNDQWQELKDMTESQPYGSNMSFKGADLTRPSSIKRWNEQPDSPTDPNILNKYPGIFTFKTRTYDSEANLPGHTLFQEDDGKSVRESAFY